MYNRTVQSVANVRRVKELKKKLSDATRVAVNSDPEVIRMTKQVNDAERAIRELYEKLHDVCQAAEERNVNNVAHIRRELLRLTNEIQDEKNNVPERVQIFLKRICNGVDYGAAHQTLWHNGRFVIFKLPPRRCWSGQGSPFRYVKASYTLYDLEKMPEDFKDRGWDAVNLERQCRLEQIRGRLSKAKLIEWKERAGFQAA